MELEIGKCFIQRNPMWGRGVARINKRIQSSVLDFERIDATIIFTSAGLEVVEHNIQPDRIFTQTGYESVSQEVFDKLLSMTRMLNVAARAIVAKDADQLCTEPNGLPPIQGCMAAKTDNGYSVIQILEADPFLPKYKVERLTIASGLVGEITQLSVKQIMLDKYHPLPDKTFESLHELLSKTKEEVLHFLTMQQLLGNKTQQEYADEYARSMKNLLDGVYDVIDVHK